MIDIKKIIRNMIKCKNCGEIVELKSVHDFKFCLCANCVVDGEHDYFKRCYKNSKDDLKEWFIVKNVDEKNK